MVTPKRKHPKKTVIQEHHITYNPEWTEFIFQGEHFILSQLQWRKKFSKGFFISLKEFVRINEAYAIDLGQGKKPNLSEEKQN